MKLNHRVLMIQEKIFGNIFIEKVRRNLKVKIFVIHTFDLFNFIGRLVFLTCGYNTSSTIT